MTAVRAVAIALAVAAAQAGAPTVRAEVIEEGTVAFSVKGTSR